MHFAFAAAGTPALNVLQLKGFVHALNALAVLGHGYALLESPSSMVRRSSDTTPGEVLTTRPGDGRVKVEVKRWLTR
ncbi:hypothetical protein [Kushneria avicenniae]|uniref:hypothetical protein n=1 Tax=Kushneria avicenniae TaxID=402385 RepID=UPI001113B1CD|nr:hypothetical protein [Kushneria avicenniae]